MKKINKIKITILKTLFSASSRTLDSFSVFKRTKVPFSDFSRNVNELKETGYINVDGILLNITLSGRKLILTISNDHLDNPQKTWREVPKSMRGPKLDINYKYVPSIRLLSKKLKPSIDNK
ncbi:hypothetical protein KP22_09045 [Pectobacterium betavasculorum]|uniref:MarR family transcriptional regulator n=1 Tax=Pectobacterium betavasculorum TaxID=55207 RepID=A0A093UCN4_9GAMM|nr:hypothetical protein [Pectobacterium betavasculorum]KFX05993.1 hypothetical protein KP22_09045 [Pectobacterium betavasculorum]